MKQDSPCLLFSLSPCPLVFLCACGAKYQLLGQEPQMLQCPPLSVPLRSCWTPL
jgi:hypothetical protein